MREFIPCFYCLHPNMVLQYHLHVWNLAEADIAVSHQLQFRVDLMLRFCCILLFLTTAGS